MSVDQGHNFTRSFPAIADTIPHARSAVAEFAKRVGATDEERDDIRLAVSEAVTNVVMHAYRGGPGSVQVSAALASGELWVLIADDGCGLQTGSRSTGLGVGLALISEVCDGFAVVNRSGGGTEVRMRFSLDGAELPQEVQAEAPRASASSPAASFFSTTR